jgi:hypothetical protein
MQIPRALALEEIASPKLFEPSFRYVGLQRFQYTKAQVRWATGEWGFTLPINAVAVACDGYSIAVAPCAITNADAEAIGLLLHQDASTEGSEARWQDATWRRTDVAPAICGFQAEILKAARKHQKGDPLDFELRATTVALDPYTTLRRLRKEEELGWQKDGGKVGLSDYRPSYRDYAQVLRAVLVPSKVCKWPHGPRGQRSALDQERGLVMAVNPLLVKNLAKALDTSYLAMGISAPYAAVLLKGGEHQYAEEGLVLPPPFGVLMPMQRGQKVVASDMLAFANCSSS